MDNKSRLSLSIDYLNQIDKELNQEQKENGSREVAIAITHLQTAILWLQKSEFIVSEVVK